ncbi:unnamed protein product [Phaedon cochleariae]|uniref:Uncharacterized protein n=1 Tax=Phaedon cochleariae TaxID=80249 RepID=A0A9N9SEC5_PHACE|nr:unnamed protein product [Phaedon cochleariae]
MLEEELNKLKETHTTPSYSSVTKNSQPSQNQKITNNVPAIIIKPTITQDSQVTKKEIQDTIDPKKINVSINSIQTSKHGCFVIKCNTEEGANKLMKETQKNKKLGEKYGIKLSQMKKPRIKIITSSTTMNKEEIEECSMKQNQFIGPDDDINVTFMKQINSGKQIIFAECSGTTFPKLMNFKRIYVGWERCPVYEDLNIPRCKTCHAYDHKDTNCRNKLTCPYCGGEHRSINAQRNTRSVVTAKNRWKNLQI